MQLTQIVSSGGLCY